ncbi:hypothetical protein [Pyrobaculum ferrireducens]|uniref:hypothetical protein n=1 Tax=Pyrobaculum ferrireducens TaxID=1104324 RepID=UPI0011E54711|nr:hypothetical protein [Pyrobaculum ferrireducens]
MLIEASGEEISVTAWAVSGELLFREHGAPARLVVLTRCVWMSVASAPWGRGEPAPGCREAREYSMKGYPRRGGGRLRQAVVRPLGG